LVSSADVHVGERAVFRIVGCDSLGAVKWRWVVGPLGIKVRRKTGLRFPALRLKKLGVHKHECLCGFQFWCHLHIIPLEKLGGIRCSQTFNMGICDTCFTSMLVG
jgi:hypothetical protein